MFEFAPISDKIKAMRAKKDVKTGRIFNTERTRIYTEYYKTHEMEHPIMQRSGALLKWAQDRYIWINDDDLFAGGPGPAYRCVTNIIEWGTAGTAAAVNDTDENFKAAWQSPGAVYMSDEDREMLRDACEYWKDKTLTSRMAAIVPDAIWNGIRGNGVTDFATRYANLSDKPQGHFVANHDKAIHVGRSPPSGRGKDGRDGRQGLRKRCKTLYILPCSHQGLRRIHYSRKEICRSCS